MRVGHQLASLIWTAVVVIAVQFVVGSALAHTGHLHDHSMHSPAPHAVHQEQLSSETPFTEASEVRSLPYSEHAGLPASSQSGGCTGGCCGNGIGCCGAVIAVSLNSLPSLRTQDARIPDALARGSGIDPDALIRPPRTLA